MCNYTPEQLKQKTDDEINEIAAVVCMGYCPIIEASGSKVYECNKAGYIRDWQPCSPTEAGKAQCWDLIEKYKLDVFEDFESRMCVSHQNDLGRFSSVFNKSLQKAVCIAAILSAQGEMK